MLWNGRGKGRWGADFCEEGCRKESRTKIQFGRGMEMSQWVSLHCTLTTLRRSWRHLVSEQGATRGCAAAGIWGGQLIITTLEPPYVSF